MPQMYFMSNVNRPSNTVRPTMRMVTNPTQSFTFSSFNTNSSNNSNVNNASNLRDMFNAIRTGSTSCKACGRG